MKHGEKVVLENATVEKVIKASSGDWGKYVLFAVSTEERGKARVKLWDSELFVEEGQVFDIAGVWQEWEAARNDALRWTVDVGGKSGGNIERVIDQGGDMPASGPLPSPSRNGKLTHESWWDELEREVETADKRFPGKAEETRAKFAIAAQIAGARDEKDRPTDPPF